LKVQFYSFYGIDKGQDLRNWHNLRQAIAEARWPSRRHDWWTLAHGSLHR
jgi:hypothetical protein